MAIKHIWVITQEEHQDSCEIAGSCFSPEGYISKEKAERRIKRLRKELGDYSGLYYSLSAVRLKDGEV